MAVTASAFDKFIGSLAAKKIDFNSDTIKCMLLASYASSQTHQYVSDVKSGGSEASGTGYTAGGATLTGVTWTKDTGGIWHLTGTIPPWNTSGGSLTARYALFYDATPGTDATNPIICYWDLAGATDVTSSNGTFTLTPHADGIVTFDAV